jgi:hypothetical protein
LDQRITSLDSNTCIVSFSAPIRDSVLFESNALKFDSSIGFGFDFYTNVSKIDIHNGLTKNRGILKTISSDIQKTANGLTIPMFVSGSNGLVNADTILVGWDSSFSLVSDRNGVICDWTEDLQGKSCTQILGRYVDIHDVLPSGDGYLLLGSIYDVAKWNGDSIDVLEIDSHSMGMSFLARVDNDFNILWRKFWHSLPHNFDPIGPPLVLRNAPIANMQLLEHDSSLFAIGSHSGGGLEIDGDTIYPHEKVSFDLDIVYLKFDITGSPVTSFKFRDKHKGQHIDLALGTDGTIIHLVYLEQFQFNSQAYPEGKYLVFLDEQLTINSVVEMPEANAVVASTDSGFYWTGRLDGQRQYGSSFINTQGKRHFVYGKISEAGQFLWAQSIPSNLNGMAISSTSSSIVVQAEAYEDVVDHLGDTIAKKYEQGYTYCTMFLEDNGLTGLQEKRYGDLNVYPNPTSEFLNISLEEPMSDALLEIYNVSGLKVKEDRMLNTTGSARFDIRELAEGFYLLRLTNVNGTNLTQKFLVAR